MDTYINLLCLKLIFVHFAVLKAAFQSIRTSCDVARLAWLFVY